MREAKSEQVLAFFSPFFPPGYWWEETFLKPCRVTCGLCKTSGLDLFFRMWSRGTGTSRTGSLHSSTAA